MIGRGVAYRKTDETDLLRSKRGSCSSGGVWRTAKRDSTGYCSSPPSTSSSLHGLPSTSSSLHGLLFIQPPLRATPPTTVQPPLHGHPSTVYFSSSPPHHGVLFNHPSTVYCSSRPPHHGVLFNHLSTGTPPPSTVHPALHTTGSCSSRGNTIAHCSSNPPAPLTVHPRGSIDRLQLAAVDKESLDRVQLTAIDRSLGFSNA